jgi:hypothetical protein
MTSEEMITAVLSRLNELDTDLPVHWTRDEILVFLNEAVTELNLISWEIQGTESRSIDSTTNIYSVPTAMLAPIAVRVGTDYLVRQTVDDIDKEARWENASEKRLKVKQWAAIGLNLFLIYPRPLSTATAYLDGIKEHTPLEDDSTALPIRAEYEPAIEDFVFERAKFKDGGPDLDQASQAYSHFLDAVQEISGRNIASMHPRYSSGLVADGGLREQVEQ